MANNTHFDTFSNKQIDHILMSVNFCLLSIFAISLNVFVIVLTRKYPRFHQPYMYVRAGYSCFDIAFALSMTIHHLIHVVFDNVPLWLSCFSSDYQIGTFLGTVQLTAFIALEIYFFFCRPYVYQRYFTLKSTVCTVIAISLIAQGYSFGTSLISGRVFQPLFSMCLVENQGIHGLIQFLVFFLPAMVCTVFSVFRIFKLMSRVDAIAAGQAMPEISVSEQSLRRRAGKKALRSVCLYSYTDLSTHNSKLSPHDK